MIVKRLDGAVIKMWTEHVPVGEKTMEQIETTARLPFIYRNLAIMPDCHWGMGATIGTVIPTRGAIVPAAVGVDIGCGMTALHTGLTAEHLPSDLFSLRTAIEDAVPHGRSDNGGNKDIGSWRGDLPPDIARVWRKLEVGYEKMLEFDSVNFRHHRPAEQLGTLGTGNHFIEVSLDEKDEVWFVLHSGSRGPGNAIGSRFIEAAKKEMKKYFIELPDKNLSYLPQGTKHYDEYLRAVNWAQGYAKASRLLMLNRTVDAFTESTGLPVFPTGDSFIDCHHNYVGMEKHFGEKVLVTRKGACRARVEDTIIIPGSMGARSFICKGLGNRDSFESCSHGAGRTMSRREAHKQFTLEDHAEATRGVECRKDKGVLDETPGAYKDIDAVMHAQKDLVEVVHELRAIVNVKG